MQGGSLLDRNAYFLEFLKFFLVNIFGGGLAIAVDPVHCLVDFLQIVIFD